VITLPGNLIIIKQRYKTNPLSFRLEIKTRLRNRLAEPDFDNAEYKRPDLIKIIQRTVEAVVYASWENDAAINFEIGKAWQDELKQQIRFVIDLACHRVGWIDVDVIIEWRDSDDQSIEDPCVIRVVDDIEVLMYEWGAKKPDAHDESSAENARNTTVHEE